MIDQARTEDTAIERERFSSHKDRSYEDMPAQGERRRRRSTRRPRRILGLWARLTLLGLAVGVLVLAAIGLVAKAIRPYREAGIQASQLAATQKQVAALDAENLALRRRVALLNTPGGIVTEARKMGYLKPGEIPFVVENRSTSPKADSTSVGTPSPSVPATPTPRSPFQRLMHRLRGHG